MLNNIIVALTALAIAAVLFSGPVRRSKNWRATVTPLASIIGSGFLIAPPILAARVGSYALVAMAFLVSIGYLVGSVIRFNIRFIEPTLEGPKADRVVVVAEKLSHLVLAFAYFISVAYYLLLLSNFLLRGFGIVDSETAGSITTAILIVLGLTGLARGLRALESLEQYAVAIKLSIIAGLLAGMAFFNAEKAIDGAWSLMKAPPSPDIETLRVILGLLILVQGFETSRFLGSAYSTKARIATMRNAQRISAVIYLAFFALVAVLIQPNPGGAVQTSEVTQIIDLVQVVASWLAPLLVIAALGSQFSAAVADMIGGAGLIEELSRRRISLRHAYPLIAAIGVVLVWSANVFEIIAFASRAFALFYFLQSSLAARTAWRQRDSRRRLPRAALFAAIAVVCLSATVFGIPAG